MKNTGKKTVSILGKVGSGSIEKIKWVHRPDQLLDIDRITNRPDIQPFQVSGWILVFISLIKTKKYDYKIRVNNNLILKFTF